MSSHYNHPNGKPKGKIIISRCTHKDLTKYSIHAWLKQNKTNKNISVKTRNQRKFLQSYKWYWDKVCSKYACEWWMGEYFHSKIGNKERVSVLITFIQCHTEEIKDRQFGKEGGKKTTCVIVCRKIIFNNNWKGPNVTSVWRDENTSYPTLIITHCHGIDELNCPTELHKLYKYCHYIFNKIKKHKNRWVYPRYRATYKICISTNQQYK